MAATGLAMLTPYLATAGIGWIYYRRLRRYFGRQPWQPRRTLARLALLSVLGLGLAYLAAMLPAVRLGMAGGTLAGVALGIFGLRHTRIELHQGVRTYVPNPWIGAGLSALLLGRLAWRWASGGFSGGGAQTLQHASPLTLAIASALIAYSLVQGLGLMQRMRALHPAP